MFRQRGPRSRDSLLEEQSILMDETQRNELGEAAGLLLNFAKQYKLINPVLGRFHVSIHQRGSAANGAPVRCADDLLPLLGGKLVARKYEADVVAEHFQVIFERHASQFDAVNDLHGRKSMNVYARNRLLYGAQNVAVVKRRQAVRQSALNANFGGADFPGFRCLLGHLLKA